MGIFNLFKKTNGQYYWHLKAANNEIICHSEIYNSKQGALGGIDACRRLSPLINNYGLFTGRDGQHYWNLKSNTNGQIICQSEGYTSRQGAQNGIRSCMENAPLSPVKEIILEGA